MTEQESSGWQMINWWLLRKLFQFSESRELSGGISILYPSSFVPQLTFIQQPTWANMISTAWIKPHGVTQELYFTPFLNVFTWWAVNGVLITFQLTSSSTIDTELTASWHPLSDHCAELHYWYQPGATWGQYDNLIIMPALAIIYRPCLRLVIRTINSISARWVLL